MSKKIKEDIFEIGQEQEIDLHLGWSETETAVVEMKHRTQQRDSGKSFRRLDFKPGAVFRHEDGRRVVLLQTEQRKFDGSLEATLALWESKEETGKWCWEVMNEHADHDFVLELKVRIDNETDDEESIGEWCFPTVGSRGGFIWA